VLETAALVATSNIALLCGLYWLLRYKPSLLAMVVRAPMPVAGPVIEAEPATLNSRPMKVCGWCDSLISKAARRCPYCTTNLGAHGG
jgi:hypothetical protein